MKYISDQQGIMERYLCEASGWDSHLKRTRAFILNCIQKYSPSSVMILGSGWLLDIPVDELNEACDRVLLVDICHPVQIHKKIKKLTNCQLIYADLTGGAVENTYRFIQTFKKSGKKESLDQIDFYDTLPDHKVAYTISVNVLNQLDILLVDYIRRFIEYPDVEIKKFRKRIQEYHLSLLKPGESCLISDQEEIIINKRKPHIQTKKLLYANLPAGIKKQHWKWMFDKEGVYNEGCNTEFNVIAIEL